MTNNAPAKPHRVRLPGIVLFSFILVIPPGIRSAPILFLVQDNTAFALDLFAQLKASPGNLFLSPYGISSCLAMTYAGARGETEKQIGRVLHFSADQKQLHASFAELQHQLNEAGKQKGIELKIANALWAQKGHPFLPAFLEVCKGDYQANIAQADFKTSSEAARVEINHWVEQGTKDKIRDILPPDSLNGLTRLVLANGIYFKGVWAKMFDRAGTSDQPFDLSRTSQIAVPLMHHLDAVRYMEGQDFQAVELPYGGGELAMVVLLPRLVDGLDKLQSQLTPGLVSDCFSQMIQRKVEIFLPRFKLESGFALHDTLAGMGMADAFGPNADFSGMDATRLLYASEVFHKAWGEVNEEGTEAAASTAFGFSLLGAHEPPPPPPVFRADHPFIFFIRDTRSGNLLFLGRLADPSR